MPEFEFALRERVIQNNGWAPHAFFQKGKILTKFGQTSSLTTDYRTVAEFQGAVTDEDLLTGNFLDSVSSSDSTDAGKTLILEGQYFTFDDIEIYPGYRPGAELNFWTGAVTLHPIDAQIPVSLPVPLCRGTRSYRPVGTVAAETPETLGAIHYFASSLAGGTTGGVPNDPNATKLYVPAGSQNSLKTATAISQKDVWWIRQFSAGIERDAGAAVSCEFQIEFKQIGGVWSLAGSRRYDLRSTVRVDLERNTDILIPPNSDVRIQVASSALVTATVHAHASGPLAVKIGT